jgi:hypothetical protein
MMISTVALAGFIFLSVFGESPVIRIDLVLMASSKPWCVGVYTGSEEGSMLTI